MQDMHRTLLFFLLASCSSKDSDQPIDDDTSHTGEVVYPSDYETGKYRSTSLTLLPSGEGLDLDGDGDLDLMGRWSTDQLTFETYDGEPIVLQWDTLRDAAAEAGVSRLYGGIHIPDGDLRGRLMGQQVAGAVC